MVIKYIKEFHTIIRRVGGLENAIYYIGDVINFNNNQIFEKK